MTLCCFFISHLSILFKLPTTITKIYHNNTKVNHFQKNYYIMQWFLSFARWFLFRHRIDHIYHKNSIYSSFIWILSTSLHVKNHQNFKGDMNNVFSIIGLLLPQLVDVAYSHRWEAAEQKWSLHLLFWLSTHEVDRIRQMFLERLY